MNESAQSQSKSLDGKEIIATCLIPGGLILIYLSLAFYAFNWRVSNEPGYSTAWEFLFPAIALCGTGGLIFVASHIFLFIRRSKLIFWAWGLCIPVTIGAVALVPILLLFMV